MLCLSLGLALHCLPTTLETLPTARLRAMHADAQRLLTRPT